MSITYKPLSGLSGQEQWVLQGGWLAQFAVRFLNDLRDRVPEVFTASVSYTPASVAANTCEENSTTVSVPGALAGDLVEVSPPSIANNIAPVAGRVSATDTVSVTFCNPTGSANAPASGTYLFKVTRP